MTSCATRTASILAALAAAPAARGQGAAGPGAPQARAASDDTVRQAWDLVRRRDFEGAIRTAKQALKRDEKHVPAMVVLARAYHDLGKLELASDILDIAAQIDGNRADIHLLRGFIALAQDQDAAARTEFQKAADLDGSNAVALNNLGARYLAAENYREALPVIERAAAARADSAEIQLNLGSALRGTGELARAEAAYRKALQLRPSYPEAEYDLGVLYLDAAEFPGLDPVQRLGRSIQHFARYKELMGPRLSRDDPVDGFVEEARKQLEREQKKAERAAKKKK